jgi:hypothetical protein
VLARLCYVDWFVGLWELAAHVTPVGWWCVPRRLHPYVPLSSPGQSAWRAHLTSMAERPATTPACRAGMLSGTADALDINGRVEGHGCHVRPARPLGHSTHCMPATGGDGYGRAPELFGTIEVAGALDINGRATGNAPSL